MQTENYLYTGASSSSSKVDKKTMYNNFHTPNMMPQAIDNNTYTSPECVLHDLFFPMEANNRPIYSPG